MGHGDRAGSVMVHQLLQRTELVYPEEILASHVLKHSPVLCVVSDFDQERNPERYPRSVDEKGPVTSLLLHKSLQLFPKIPWMGLQFNLILENQGLFAMKLCLVLIGVTFDV